MIITPLDDLSVSETVALPEAIPFSHFEASRETRSAYSDGKLSPTQHWVPEIEKSLVSLVWRVPDLVGQVRQQIDPRIHLSQPTYRLLLEVISTVFSDEGVAPWSLVIAAIHEIPGAFEEAGGLEGLNDIYTNGGFGPLGICDPEPKVFARAYIEFLKLAAVQRGIDPSAPILRYSAGSGILQLNKLATNASHPSVTGTFRAPLPGTFRLSGWPQGEDEIRLKGQLQERKR